MKEPFNRLVDRMRRRRGPAPQALLEEINVGYRDYCDEEKETGPIGRRIGGQIFFRAGALWMYRRLNSAPPPKDLGVEVSNASAPVLSGGPHCHCQDRPAPGRVCEICGGVGDRVL